MASAVIMPDDRDRYRPRRDDPDAPPVSLLNEPNVDFAVDYSAAEEPKESATARAMRIWFKQNPTVEKEPSG